MENTNDKILKINNFLKVVDNEFLKILESSISHYEKNLYDTEFIFNKQKQSLEINLSHSALDYLISKVKLLFLQTMLFEIRILDDDLDINKYYLNTDKYVSYMVFDLIKKEMKEVKCEEIKEMKYGFSQLDNFDDLIGTQASFRDYHDKLREVGKMDLREYFKKDYKYTPKGSFLNNVEFKYCPSTFIKKDLAFLYAEADIYSKKIRKKTHYYLDEFSSTNFYYISFLINEFGKKSTVFKSSNLFFSYIIPSDEETQDSKTDINKEDDTKKVHKHHGRDFETMVKTYNKHIASANSYKEKLITFMNQEIMTNTDEYNFSNADIVSLINFHFLTNNTLRSDFFSSLGSFYIQNIINKIPIETLYNSISEAISNQEKRMYIKSLGNIHSINEFMQNRHGCNSESSHLFYLKLLELLMIFNIDTNHLSVLSFYKEKEDIDNLSIDTQSHSVLDSYVLLNTFEKIVYDFLSKSYSLILNLLKNGIELYNELEHDKLLIQTLQDILIKQFDIKYDLDEKSFTSKPFNCIPESTCILYINKSINDKLIISYLFNASGRNRIILDYFYHLSPHMNETTNN